MYILKRPDSLSLVGNMNRLVVSTTRELLFVLKDHSGTVIVENSYEANDQYQIEIDIKSIVLPLLGFALNNTSSPYQQTAIVQTFTAEVSEVIDSLPSNTQSISFKVLRAGVDEFSDSTENFLEQNFLTWQPNTKYVTYYSPEFLTYYSISGATIMCRATMEDGSTSLISLASIPAGQCWTVPVQYAVIAGKLSKLPVYYDVWAENSSGQRMTYVQRYVADTMKSIVEEWILFENSLGGIDTFRAYGDSENTAEHTHNIVEIDDKQKEYRVDTERKHTKNTGFLDIKERNWLLDFFPSLGKYIYTDQHIRQIIVTESNVSYNAKTLPSTYTFTYRYTSVDPYLNLPRSNTPQDVLELKVPSVGSFTIAPRLVEFPRQVLSRGALFPIQDPYSEGWGTTTIEAVCQYLMTLIESDYGGTGGSGHTHINLPMLETLSLIGDYLTTDGKKISAGYADVAGELADTSSLHKLFLSKISNDTAQGIITFLKGLVSEGIISAKQGVEIGEFVTGLFGRGGKIDGDGRAELRSLTLWEWLEVPEIRFNRISVNIGLSIRSEGGGTIEMVKPDYDADGNLLATGACWLKLEEGEYGAIAVADLCMGLWHDLGGGNATESTDDKKGTYQVRGFKTVYFWITDVPDIDPDGLSNSDQHFFRYALRPTEEGGNGMHPCAMMHFAQRGNADNEERQSIVYSTTKYDLSLCNLDSWYFRDSQIYQISRCLDGFTMEQIGDDGKVYTKKFSGYGVVMGNAYIYGKIDEFERAGFRIDITRTMAGTVTTNAPDVIGIRVVNGYGADVSAKFTTYKVTRDSGDAESDAEWNAAHTSVGQEFTITADDLGMAKYLQPVMFTITASGEGMTDIAASFTERFVSTEELHIEFQPVEGKSYVVKASNVDTIIEARLYFGSEDITDSVLLRSSSVMKWTRDSGIPTEDAAWTATTEGSPNIIHIIDRVDDRHDCGSYWMEKLKVIFAFECNIVFAVGEISMAASMQLGNS